MAQVKKFQKGGGLYLDGKLLTDEQINAAMDTLSTEDKYTWSKSIERARSGERVDLNELANSVTGGDFSHVLTERQLGKNTSGNLNRRQRNRHARWGTNIDSTNRGIANGISALKAQLNTSESQQNFDKLGRGTGWFDRDESGKYIEGPSNLSREAYIRKVYDHLSGNKKYNLEGWDDTDTLNGLTSWYKAGMTAEDLISSIRSGELSAEQIDVLGKMGFVQSDAQKVQTESNQNKAKLTAAGYDFNNADQILGYDNDGNLIATDALLEMFGGDRSKNYWLNDVWAGLKTEDGQINPYSDYLKGHVIIGGKVYKQDDPEVLKYMQDNGYVSANASNNFEKADSIIYSTWGSPTSHSVYNGSTVYSPWAKSKEGLRYRGISGYDLGDDSKQLIEYYDNSSQRNQYGLVDQLSYAILDQYGNLIEDNVDLSKYNKTGDVTGKEVLFRGIHGSEAGRLSGTYTDVGQSDNTASDFFVHIDPSNGRVFLQDPEMKGNQKGKALQLPKEVSDLIPEQTWDYFRTNKSAKGHLLNALRDLTSSKWSDFWTDFPKHRLIKDFEAAFVSQGLSDASVRARQIVETLERFTDNKTMPENWKFGTSKRNREATFLVNPEGVKIEKSEIGAFKLGGKITKHQYGQLVGGENKGTKGVTAVRKLEKPVEHVSKSWGLGSNDSKQWSGLDTAEVTALIADLGALGVTLVDPTNVGGTLAGVIGSTANLAADVKRDGFQLKDLGSYGLNLAMDLGTLIPVAGDAISGAKAVRTMKKAAPVLAKAIKLGAIAGVSDAVYNTIDKIAKGESFTISDVRRIVNGISGGITLGKTGLLNKTSKTVKSDPGLFKGKNKSDDIKLSKSEIESISSKPKEDQLLELQSKIVEKYRSKNGSTTKTDEEILALYDIPTKKSINPKWKFWKSSLEEIPEFKASKERVLLSNSELDKISKDRNRFTNWFFGTGKNHRYYNNWLQTGNLPVFEHNVPIGQWARHLSVSPDGSSASYGNWYRFSPTWAPTKISHKNPFGKFSITPMSSIIPSWQYSETEIPEPWFVGEPINMNGAIVFKQGGKIQFAKDGKKIVKAQPGLKVPMSVEDWKQYYVEPGSTFNDVMLSITSTIPTESTTTKSPAVSTESIMTEHPVAPTASRSYKIDSGNNTFSLNIPTLEKPAAILSPDSIEAKRDALLNLKTAKSQAKSTGNPYGEKTSGLNWGDIGNQLLQKTFSVGDLLSNLKGSKNQDELAKQIQVPLEGKVIRKNPGFDDNGIALAYDQQIGNLNSVKGTSSDYLTNFAIERSYKDNVFDLIKQKNLAMSQAYANWQNQNQQRIAQQDEQDRQIEFANDQRLAQKHNSILQSHGAHEAQVRQSMSNFSKQLQQDLLQKQMKNDALKKMQLQTDYTTQFANKWTDDYKREVSDGSKTFSEWLNADPALRDKYQKERLEWQKKFVFKKGGKVRPASEQIWIDKQKSTAKAVERLSKQAYELLKMALS